MFQIVEKKKTKYLKNIMIILKLLFVLFCRNGSYINFELRYDNNDYNI